jgi:uncharacterized repeat protein (TIGR01451 family)
MKTIVDVGLGYWEGLNPINGLGRSRPAAAGVNGKVYVIGGEISGGRADTVEEFDPATGIWTTKAGLMPTPASNVCAAAIGSDIYIPGGYDAAGAYLNTLQVYHVDTDTWETIATDPLPAAKAGPGCAALDGKLYAYAGVTTGGGYTNTAFVYDPAAPAGTRWTALPDMAYSRGYMAGAAVNGKVYAVGGRDGTTADFAYVEAYDPADAMWHTLTNMNFARGGPGAFAWDDNLVVCGGGWTTYRNTCEVYDTTQGYGGSWTNLTQTMITGRRTYGYATLPDALYAVAGYNSTFLTAAERLPIFECPSCGLQFPDIVVDPLSFDVVLPPDATTTLPLTISNVGDAPLEWFIASWFDTFDSYAAGSQIHGQGGWKGWFNDPAAGALVSDLYAHSSPNSVEIVGASDLVHEYAGYTTGTWTYTAWQYIPSGFSGQSYFILLNTYNDQGIDLNWSTQVTFNSATGLVENLGITGGTLPLITDLWVELRVEIDLDSDTQAFFYDDQLLYEGTWTDENSGDGALNIGAVDLFANGASPVYYDDISLAGEIPPWLSVAPDSGMVDPGLSTLVDVTFDSTGLAPGVYTTELDISSNDPGEPLITLPVMLTVVADPDIVVDPLSLEAILPVDYSTTLPLTISNVGDSPLEWLIYEAGWYDNFDSYAPGSQMHGQGGWKGWFNNPAAGALVSDAYSHSDPNSVAVVGATDLVHEYAGYTADTWTYTAWQYIPGTYSGQTYFIMLNTYNDDNVGLNWSTQVCFNSATDRLYDDVAADCSSGASLSIVYDQWVEIRVEIDLDNDIQTLYYNGEMLYQDSWTDHVSGDGALNIGAVDLFANNASEIYYDDISLVGECGNPAEIPWLSATPYNGTIDPGLFTLVDVGFDSTGMATGEYTADLCIASNDPDEPVVTVPVTMTVVAPAIELDKTVGTEEGVCAVTDAIEVVAGTEVFYCYTVENVGDTILYYHTLNDSALGVLFADMPYELGVGASYSYIHSAVPITESVVNTGTWYAYLELGGYYVSAVDTASVSVLPEPEEADLSVTKEGPAMVYVGEDITYLLTVANAGPADATGVFLTDILPVGVTFVSASTGCVEAEGIVTCDVGDLAAGASVEITIVVTAPAEPDTLTNDVEVSGDQPDPFLDNNTDSFDTEVAEVPVEYYQYYLPLIFKP